ncbi:hypothetical protein [Arthrobacter nitrophenolicus]|uniref:Uncharacterized protein n=1 Tax=Arthrobacter nitrophenolicus TaxID=683150 RepID=A0A4R5XT23_9MICC|nr:hypothetical protein [Arthrobacter nitrophenolicus]TDL34036.1 hypothetical protein E2R57_16130 [Arthrobacter nitrophenolicus]
MNPGQLLAIGGVVVLILGPLLDKLMEQIDLPLFKQKIESNPMLGLQDWFSDNKKGDIPAKTVLRYARFSSSVRTVIVALLANLSGLAITWIIVATASPQPDLAWLRIVGVVPISVLVLAGFVVLVTKIIANKLRPSPVTTKRSGGIKNSFIRYRKFPFKLNYLMPYNLLALGAGIFTFIIGFGI